MDFILGTAQFAQNYGIFPSGSRLLEQKNPDQILNQAEQLDFTAVDTAPVYGLAETIIGKSRTALEVHTKLRPGTDFSNSLADSLLALGREQVEVVYLHDSALLHHLDMKTRSSLMALESLGAGSLGASVYEEHEFSAVLNSGIFQVVQVPLNLFDTRFGIDWVRRARDQGVKVFARSIFLQGVLLAQPVGLPAFVRALSPYLQNFLSLCSDWEVKPIDALCRFVIEKTAVDGVIVGVSAPSELRGLSQAFKANVPDGFLEILDNMDRPDWHLIDPRNWR
ncbi:aldo/keto reductase [Pontimonas sp.]|nr:aldo/keto reductase [Pontimonas sp.]